MTEQPRGWKLPMRAARNNPDSDHPTNAQSGTIFLRQVNTRSAQSIFHSIFTSFQRHITFPNAVFVQARTAIENTKILKIPAPLRNNHIVQRNLEVLSWTKPVKHKNEIGQYDDNIGEDSLSSQSTYVQDIEDEEYLQRLCPSPRFLATDAVTDKIELRDVYASLFKAVYDLCVKRQKRGLNEENKFVDTYIVELHASLVVNRHDDIEFYEWAYANTSHVIWSCHDIFKSPILESAIKN
jgi:hypothetical protein